MIAPDTADFIQQRLVGMGIGNNQIQREIRGHKGIGQRGKGNRHKRELQAGRRAGNRHPRAPIFMCANHRHNHLERSHGKGQNQSKMAKFNDHLCPPSSQRDPHDPDFAVRSRQRVTTKPPASKGLARKSRTPDHSAVILQGTS